MKNKLSWFLSMLIVVTLVTGIALGCGPEPPPPPQPPKFEITSLTVTPLKIELGQSATLEASVANSGGSSGTYTAVLKIDSSQVETKDVTVGAGEKTTVSFSYTAQKSGKYQVDINGKTSSLEVLKPAEFQVSSVTTVTNKVVVGATINITAKVVNKGDVEGTFTAILKVDSKQVDTKEVKIAAGITNEISFPLTLKEKGTHTLDVGGIATTLDVLEPGKIGVRSISVQPAIIFPGEEAKIQATIGNDGQTEGPMTMSLAVNGIVVDSRQISLQPGSTQDLTFPFVRDVPGKYEISLNGVSAPASRVEVADVETHFNDRYYFSVSYPKGWEIKEYTDAAVMQKSGEAVFITAVEEVEIDQSLSSLYPSMLELWTGKLSGRQIVSEQDVKSSGADSNLPHKKTVVTYNTSGGLKVTRTLDFIKNGRYLYALETEALSSTYISYFFLFDACLRNFKPPETAVGSYTDTENGFSVALPQGWSAVKPYEHYSDRYILDIHSPVVNSTNVFMYMVQESLTKDTTSEEYATTVANGFSKSAGYNLITKGAVSLSTGAQGYQYVFTNSQDGVQMRRKVVSLVRGTQALTLITMAADSTYQREQSGINQVYNSLTLVERRPFGVSRQDSLFLYEGEIVTLDPALSEEAADGIIGALYSGLVKYDKDLKIVPDIAEKWEVTADGKTYTFHLRENAKFHDGKQVSAADFKYSWERALDPATKSDKASTYLGDIVGAKDILDGKTKELSGVKVIDARTLEVTIDGAKPYFLGKLAYVTSYVVDKANVARGMNWTDEPNGTGPFKLKEWKKNELLVLERNDNFYLGPAKLKNVVFRIYAGSPMMMYEQGEIDITGVGSSDFERVTDTANPLNKELQTVKSFGIGYLGFNVTKPPFDDPKVREAFALALDMDKILEVSLKGRADRSGNLIPPGIPGYNAELKPLPFDPARARQLIAESKYGSVAGLPPIILYVAYGAGAVDEAMIAMWKLNLGVEVKVEAIKELKEYYERSHNREFQLFNTGWRADYIDPQDFLEVLFQSQSEENRLAYSNPAVDAALKEAAVEQDEAARIKKYQEIEKMILKDLPAVPFYQSSKDYGLIKPYVKGFSLLPIGVNQWSQVSISR